MLNLCQIASPLAAADVPVAEFSSFANFKERKRKSNLLMSFPKIVHQKGSLGQIRKNSLFHFCRPILNIFGLTLLNFSFLCFSRQHSGSFETGCSSNLLSFSVSIWNDETGRHYSQSLSRTVFLVYVITNSNSNSSSRPPFLEAPYENQIQLDLIKALQIDF